MSDDPTETPDVIDAEAVEESKPLAKDLVVRGASIDDSAIFRTMDRHDEQQILDELVGRQLKEMVYSFGSGSDRKTGLSYAGVQECVRTLNARGATRIKIAAEPAPIFEEYVESDEGYIQCTVYAVDELNGGGAWGTATEPKNMRLRNGGTKRDFFARTKALSKAQRNAEKALLPEEFIQLLIAMYVKDETRVREIREGLLSEADLPELPPPVDDDEMRAKMAEARDLYAEITRLVPGGVGVKLTPASFHRYATRAETDHERAGGFLSMLREKLEQARAAKS